MNLPDITHHDVYSLIAGIAGGAVTLVRTAKKRYKPLKVGQVIGALFVAAFTSWLISLLLPHDMSQDIRTAICGIAGMSGERVLTVLESTYMNRIKNIVGGGVDHDKPISGE